MTYFRKPLPVKAIKYDGTNFKAIAEMLGSPEEHYAHEYEIKGIKHISITTNLQHMATVEIGEIVVRDANDIVYALEEAEFKKYFIGKV